MFPDLRTNNSSRVHEESFWPSFTDMMMVIAMMFLMVSSILILRNFELLNNLKETAESERIAKEHALEKLRENEELIIALQTEHQIRLDAEADRERVEAERQRIADEKALADLEKERLSEAQEKLKNEMLSLSGQNETLSSKIEALLADLNRYRNSALDAAQQKKILAEKLHNLTLKLEAMSNKNKALESAFDEAMQAQQSSSSKLVKLEAKVAEKDAQIETLNTDKLRITNALSSSKEEYDSLKVKYNKLIRPARSPENKEVAQVVYLGEGQYQLTPPNGTKKILNDASLHQHLGQLKQGLGKNLYVRIIIPDSVDVSHSRAWAFTNDLLSKYDYYHQP